MLAKKIHLISITTFPSHVLYQAYTGYWQKCNIILAGVQIQERHRFGTIPAHKPQKHRTRGARSHTFSSDVFFPSARQSQAADELHELHEHGQGLSALLHSGDLHLHFWAPLWINLHPGLINQAVLCLCRLLPCHIICIKMSSEVYKDITKKSIVFLLL